MLSKILVALEKYGSSEVHFLWSMSLRGDTFLEVEIEVSLMEVIQYGNT